MLIKIKKATKILEEPSQFPDCTKKTADLVTFTEEILNGKLHFVCIIPHEGVFRTLFIRVWQGSERFALRNKNVNMHRFLREIL